MSDEEEIDSVTETPHESMPENKTSLLAKIRIVALIVAAALVLIVVARNWESTTIDFFGKKAVLPQALLVVLSFLFGVGAGLLLAYLRPWRKKKD